MVMEIMGICFIIEVIILNKIIYIAPIAPKAPASPPTPAREMDKYAIIKPRIAKVEITTLIKGNFSLFSFAFIIK